MSGLGVAARSASLSAATSMIIGVSAGAGAGAGAAAGAAAVCAYALGSSRCATGEKAAPATKARATGKTNDSERCIEVSPDPSREQKNGSHETRDPRRNGNL